MATMVKSMATSGVDGFMVEIEASTIRGQQQALSIIGLPDQAIKEAGERIQAAIVSGGYDHCPPVPDRPDIAEESRRLCFRR